MHNPKRDDLSAETGSILPIPNKTVIKKHVKAIIERLNSAENENLEDIEIMPINLLRNHNLIIEHIRKNCKKKIRNEMPFFSLKMGKSAAIT